jgi:hypothetical protein
MRSIAFALVLLWSAAAGAVPKTVNFTGRLTTSAGPVNGAVNITLKLFVDATGGTDLWNEVHNNVGADNGLVFLDIGSSTTLDDTVLDGRRLFLEITVGGETLSPRLAFNSVPYAVRTDAAATADLLGGSIGPGDVVTAVTGAAGLAATRTGNTVTVGLTTTGCTSGQVFKFNGTTFACAADAVGNLTAGNGIAISGTTISLATTGCTSGQVYKFNGTTFACAADAVGSFTATAGNGIDITGTTISLATTGCTSGQVYKFNGTSFACAADAVGSFTATAGNGIAVSGSTISLATTGCANGQVYKFNGTTFACAADAVGLTTANAPLTLNGTTTTVSLAACTSNGQILRWNGTSWVCSADLSSSSCVWKVAMGASASTNQSAACPTGKHPVSGGCDAAGTSTVTQSRPFGPPTDGDAASSVTQWFCEFSAPALAGHTAYALCCDTI